MKKLVLTSSWDLNWAMQNFNAHDPNHCYWLVAALNWWMEWIGDWWKFYFISFTEYFFYRIHPTNKKWCPYHLKRRIEEKKKKKFLLSNWYARRKENEKNIIKTWSKKASYLFHEVPAKPGWGLRWLQRTTNQHWTGLERVFSTENFVRRIFQKVDHRNKRNLYLRLFQIFN